MSDAIYRPDTWAAETPERPAVILGETGQSRSFSELAERSIAIARMFTGLGLNTGDVVAFCLENRLEFIDLCWGAERAGLRYVAVSHQLTPDEIAYIVEDSGARAFVTSDAKPTMTGPLRQRLSPDLPCLMAGTAAEGYASLDWEITRTASVVLEDRPGGTDMLYSSGTTGRPKGIFRQLPEAPFGAPRLVMDMLRGRFKAAKSSVYLCPAPLYHAAPLRFSMAMIALGATVVVMPKFDAEGVLRLIGEHGITHSQWVPTMFARLLALPEETRAQADVSSMQCAIHAAAPCPAAIKQAMIDWWGPVIHEYYSSSEGVGVCLIDSAEWLAHPGSVGRSLRGPIHVLDDAGNALPPGEVGTIWFEGGPKFEYLNAPEKTAECFNEKGWASVGDIGKVDEEGFLYLTDRKAFMIISGGVNIYPQEVEAVLETHPDLADVAVFGIPDPEFGEQVKAVVVPAPGASVTESEVIAYCAARIAKLKCPGSVDFVAELPRSDTGKLLKAQLRDTYLSSKGNTGTGA